MNTKSKYHKNDNFSIFFFQHWKKKKERERNYMWKDKERQKRKDLPFPTAILHDWMIHDLFNRMCWIIGCMMMGIREIVDSEMGLFTWVRSKWFILGFYYSSSFAFGFLMLVLIYRKCAKLTTSSGICVRLHHHHY